MLGRRKTRRKRAPPRWNKKSAELVPHQVHHPHVSTKTSSSQPTLRIKALRFLFFHSIPSKHKDSCPHNSIMSNALDQLKATGTVSCPAAPPPYCPPLRWTMEEPAWRKCRNVLLRPPSMDGFIGLVEMRLANTNLFLNRLLSATLVR